MRTTTQIFRNLILELIGFLLALLFTAAGVVGVAWMAFTLIGAAGWW